MPAFRLPLTTMQIFALSRTQLPADVVEATVHIEADGSVRIHVLSENADFDLYFSRLGDERAVLFGEDGVAYPYDSLSALLCDVAAAE